MSEEQFKAFLEKIKGDSSLQEKLKAAADVDAVLAIAKEAGFMISAEDLKNAQVTELSDEELEGAAAGEGGWCQLIPVPTACVDTWN
ncbi:nif11-like leader peptide domain protein [Synechococcus sp. BIOS-E4-1]|uniref:Nif11-like leader peptide family natural product precursor n=1 Tax=Synechococcus sp. BIOS-E4-1 TaxID=1400864 RepID=UPI0016483133|nr:Nif11-like leader peptide family natural product precursor [Synechococcus sp. BIOS-E4-1]QNI56412.1 nif11-like leader peptide domain protein [Synechococcus sp. BIOS-E4-1]